MDGSRRLGRRAVVGGLLGLGALSLESLAQDASREIADLQPGEFTWHPERQPDGPVAVVVSIPQQLVHVYRNGVRIAVSTCSTGKPGHATPRGVFVVLQKDRHHHSSTYNNAPMPNMNRLTWSGIALHAGDLPGYPASHGCIRLPLEFSEKLFGVTHLGTPVIIADDHGDPWELTHPGLILAPQAEETMEVAEAALEGKSAADDWVDATTNPILSLIASSADHRILMIQSGLVVMESLLSIAGGNKLGNNVMVLQGMAAGGMGWLALSHGDALWDPGKPDDQILGRITTEASFRDVMVRHMHPGMMLVTTDLPLRPDTRTSRDFVIMS